MLKNSKVTDPTASGQVAIKRRSKVPGVMITQFVEKLPEGKTAPDFTRKPIALTIQEGKLAVFKAIVTGDPTPTVTWSRKNGNLGDPDKYKCKYNPISGEHTLEMPDVSVEAKDTYKCVAVNEFGKAGVTVTLNIIEVGFKKSKAMQESRTALRENTLDFKRLLKTRSECEKPVRKEGDVDDKVWEILLSADRKDYEQICLEFGITDFRWMLKKLNELKRERDEEQAMFIEHLSNLKHIEVKPDGCAEFEISMDLKDPNSRVFLYKDGVLVPFEEEANLKHCLKKVGKKYVFSIKDLGADDAGLYQVDVEGVNIFSTEFKIPPVDFLVKIQEVNAVEREDALFECVISHPLPKITWMGKSIPLQAGEKYDITVSEDRLIHRLVVKDCMQVDKGIYAAVAGIKSCNAWLLVEADKDPNAKGKKKARKNTVAGGSGIDVEEIAQKQQAKLQKERGEMNEKMQKAKEDMEAAVREEMGEEAEWNMEVEDELTAGKRQASNTSTDGSETSVTEASKSVVGQLDGTVSNEPEVGVAKGDHHDHTNTRQTKVNEGLAKADGQSLLTSCTAGDESSTSGSLEDNQAGRLIAIASEGELPNDLNANENKDNTNDRKKRTRTGPLVPDTVKDPGVHFASGLSNVNAILGEPAELICKLSKENCDGIWYKDGKQLTSTDGFIIIKEGAWQKLLVKNCQEEDSGKYRFEADGRKTEAILTIEDPPRFNSDDLTKFSEPIIVKAGQNACFKMTFLGREPMKVQWYKEGEELFDDTNIKLEKTSTESYLVLSKLQRRESGEIKLKVKNEFSTIEAFSRLIILDKPTPPLAPIDIIESSAKCIEFKWRPPKDDGGSPVTNYILERQQLGRNSWKKLGEISGNPTYKDTDVDHGRKYCYHIWAKNSEGLSEMMETEDIMAGTKAYPGPPAPPKVVSAFKDSITLSWTPHANTGGSNILGYNLEKRKNGSNLWSQINPINEPIQAKTYVVKDVVEGLEYEFRVSAINNSGAGEPSSPSEYVFARDPKKPPGQVIDLKVTDSSYSTLSLSWTKPNEKEGVQDEAKGYFVEIRPAEDPDWIRCNTHPINLASYTVKGLKSMSMYWVRVIAVNEGGEGEPKELDNYILAMPPPVKPQFTDTKLKTFIVVRVGNSARVTINFVASPWPEVTWLKDGAPVSKRVTVSNAEGTSQLLIPSSERSDSGIYTIIVKNLVGLEMLSIEIRVTDDPRPPGPIDFEQNVPGTLTISWVPSLDEKLDNRLHYMVTKRDSVKRTWHTVADQLFNHNFTAINVMPGREYSFRVYAKNDMGISEPSLSGAWELTTKKDKFILPEIPTKVCNLQTAPSFTVQLKAHNVPPSYECYMSCAVRGNPAPRVTWYRNDVSINTNPNYYITNTCGVCSMLILRVDPKDRGTYKVIAENLLGRAECSTMLSVREANLS